jgi:hypothetical protein
MPIRVVIGKVATIIMPACMSSNSFSELVKLPLWSLPFVDLEHDYRDCSCCMYRKRIYCDILPGWL